MARRDRVAGLDDFPLPPRLVRLVVVLVAMAVVTYDGSCLGTRCRRKNESSWCPPSSFDPPEPTVPR